MPEAGNRDDKTRCVPATEIGTMQIATYPVSQMRIRRATKLGAISLPAAATLKEERRKGSCTCSPAHCR